MAKKERPIFSIVTEKVLKNTGTSGKPFYAKVAEHTRTRIFGILIKKVSVVGEFPDPDEKG